MKTVNWKTTVPGSLEDAISLATRALQREGFGVLTRIDLHKKFHEKLGKTIPPAVILGACAPSMAYEAYTLNSDVASVLPCNVVVRELDQKMFSVEIARPTAMMAIIGDHQLTDMANQADAKLEHVLMLIKTATASRQAHQESGATLRNLEEECWDRDGRWGLCRDENEPQKKL